MSQDILLLHWLECFCMWVHCSLEFWGLQWISLLVYHDQWLKLLKKVCYITVEKNDTAAFMLCLDLSLSNKGQIILLVFTWIEQVAHVLDHYLCEKIWIPWWPVLIVQIYCDMDNMQRKRRDKKTLLCRLEFG